MKKINKIAALLSLPFLMLLSSCMDPIFYELRKDVKPETATVSGNISTVTRFTEDGTEYLYTAADKGLRRKRADNESHDAWSEKDIPFSLIAFDWDSTSFTGEQLLAVLANSDTLYLISVDYSTTGTEGNTNPSKLNLWGKQSGGSWKKIDFSFPLGYNYESQKFVSLFSVFQTNSPQAAHRHAYVCKRVDGEYKCFELKGTDAPEEITITKVEDGNPGDRLYSAVWFDGGVKFFTSHAATTNETYNEAEAPTRPRLYYADGEDLYYSGDNYSSDGKYVKALDSDRVISALTTCKDSILIGYGDITNTSSEYGGIGRASLDENGIPASSTSSFSTNAAFQITSAYAVLTLLNATPEKNETDSALYASITFSSSNGLHENIGLWSYYPGRGNWNRE